MGFNLEALRKFSLTIWFCVHLLVMLATQMQILVEYY